MSDFTLSGEAVTLALGLIGVGGVAIQRAVALGGIAKRIEMKLDMVVDEQGRAKQSRSKLHDQVSKLEKWTEVHEARHDHITERNRAVST